MTGDLLVKIEVLRDGPPEVISPVPWPWPLPRHDDVISYGSPRRRATVDHVRFELDALPVIVCDRWPA